jgi:hypothetical protein
MARSKKRKAAVARSKEEKRREHGAHQTANRLKPVVDSILASNIPVINRDGRSKETLEKWFDCDPAAPVVVLSHPPKTRVGASGPIQISFNAKGVERELRKNGIDESHPDWEDAYHLTMSTFQVVTQMLISEWES